MAKYDCDKARTLIQEAADTGTLESAYLGMAEDWYWTSEKVHDGNNFTDAINNGEIAGISGSYWATPTLELTFNDGTVKTIDCFVVTEDSAEPTGEMNPAARALLDSFGWGIDDRPFGDDRSAFDAIEKLD